MQVPAANLWTEMHIDQDGTYFISGGLGGFGFEVAVHLVEKGAKHLVLCGRKEPAPDVALRLQDLQKKVEITVAHVDVADMEQISSLLKGIRNLRFTVLLARINLSAVVFSTLLEYLDALLLWILMRAKWKK